MKFNEEETKIEEYNDRIENIDNLILADEEFITLIKDYDNSLNTEEIMLSASYECTNKNEFKILIMSIIIGLLIICKSSDIILGINEKSKPLYMNLIIFKITIIDSDEKEYRIINDIKKRMRGILDNQVKEKKTNYKIELIESALLINEYNLIWKKKIVTGGFRKWRKKKEFDWQSTLEFISNRINFSARQCNVKDTRDRSYRIKYLLIDLPTYSTLYNESTMEEIAEESIYKYEKYLEDKDRKEDIEILRKYNFDFIRILEENSKVLLGKNRIWELLRGVYNNNFNDLTKMKEEKIIIKELWNLIYEEFRSRIWLPRCEEIARLEKLDGIQKQYLKRKKKIEKVMKDHQVNEETDKIIKKIKTQENLEKTKQTKKFNKNIRLATQDRMIGSITDGNNNLGNTWDLIPKLI
ncbi:hypothetical protein C1646_820816 [Rhizophagus diaphanus]|nr:hypothetical protein C1646_820816 [Rhizophagus diaphanus] [Rhizophagus sp. MUCL 43196]